MKSQPSDFETRRWPPRGVFAILDVPTNSYRPTVRGESNNANPRMIVASLWWRGHGCQAPTRHARRLVPRSGTGACGHPDAWCPRRTSAGPCPIMLRICFTIRICCSRRSRRIPPIRRSRLMPLRDFRERSITDARDRNAAIAMIEAPDWILKPDASVRTAALFQWSVPTSGGS